MTQKMTKVVWFFLVLYDGNYYACSQTDWDGVYVHDQVLEKKWCKPTDGNASRELQLRNKTQTFVKWSQFASYILLIVFCAVTFVLVCVYDCQINFTCCGNEQQDSEEEEMNPMRTEVYGYIVLAVFGLVIIVTVGLFEWCKRTPPEEHDGAQSWAQNEEHDRPQNRAQSDAHAQDSAENRPKTELKPLLSSAAKDVQSSV